MLNKTAVWLAASVVVLSLLIIFMLRQEPSWISAVVDAVRDAQRPNLPHLSRKKPAPKHIKI